jgi:hypothetical protein
MAERVIRRTFVRIDFAVTDYQPAFSFDLDDRWVKQHPEILAVWQLEHLALPRYLVLERWYVLLVLKQDLFNAVIALVLYATELSEMTIDLLNPIIYGFGTSV